MSAAPVLDLEALVRVWEQGLAPFLRVGGAVMSAPVFGARNVSMRVRLMLALALTAVLWPLASEARLPEVFSLAGVAVVASQIALGVALGLMLQIVFEAVLMGGELMSLSMGLSFAQLTDPLRNASASVLSQLFLILATLLFLCGDGHHVLITLLAQSFRLWPVDAAFDARLPGTLIAFGGQVFAGGVAIALPAMTALLIVNLMFGLISRVAPTLNLMAVGLPLTLVVGLLVLYFTLPGLAGVFSNLMQQAVQGLAALAEAPGV